MKKNLTICIILAMSVTWSIESNAQSSSGNNSWGSTKYLGWSSSHDLPFSIGTGPTLLMTLKSGGDLNLETTSKAFQIGGNSVLWHNNHTEDIFVGVSAGNSTMTGHRNTLVGNSAGTAISTADSCTFIGYEAGKSNTICMYNTAIGYQALYTQSTCPLCWDHASATNSALNTAVGFQALYTTEAYGGCALGFRAGYNNTAGCALVAIGEEAALHNTTGNYNVAIGEDALHENLTGKYNTCVGNDAGYGTSGLSYDSTSCFGKGAGGSLASSTNNVFIGYQSGNKNTFASDNTAVGVQSLYTQSYQGSADLWHSYNTAVGYRALYSNQPTSTSNGIKNAALGYQAGYANTTGNKNTFVGYAADANAGTYTNCAAIGYNTVALASNKMYFGDANVIGCYNTTGTWAASDGRFKINVQENVNGLDFIKRLRPVTYNMDTHALNDFLNQNRDASYLPPDDFTASTNIVHAGFIAQEVEQASQASGFTSSIVSVPSNANDIYALNYAEVVVPLVKAVQQLDSTNQALQTQLSDLQTQMQACCLLGGGHRAGANNGNNGLNENQNSNDRARLDQNVPNPFNSKTEIHFYLPVNSISKTLMIFDMQGTLLKQYALSEKGESKITINGNEFRAGMYLYSLIIDEKEIDTKRMILTN